MPVGDVVAAALVLVSAAFLLRRVWNSWNAKDSCGGCGSCGRPQPPKAVRLISLERGAPRRSGNPVPKRDE